MKYLSSGVSLLFLLGWLVACSANDQVLPPEAIKEGIDRCEVCHMLVPNNHHATQLLLQDGRSLKFDDIGDLNVWIKDHGTDDVNAQYVRDYQSEEWILIEDASFVYDSEIRTPMAYGVISFQSEDEAIAFIEAEGKGELLSYEELQQHHWTQNMELMDHDHHDHGHGDHGHHEHGHDDHDQHDHQDHEHDEGNEHEHTEQSLDESFDTNDDQQP